MVWPYHSQTIIPYYNAILYICESSRDILNMGGVNTPV